MPYLTYRMTQVINTAIKIADPIYQAAVGLKIRELRVLRLIHEHPHSTSSELLNMIELDKSLLSRNLTFLEEQGLITRQSDPNDARRQYIDLSQKGQEIWQKAEEIGQKLEKEIFADLSEKQWKQLHDLLNISWESLQKWQEMHKEEN